MGHGVLLLPGLPGRGLGQARDPGLLGQELQDGLEALELQPQTGPGPLSTGPTGAIVTGAPYQHHFEVPNLLVRRSYYPVESCRVRVHAHECASGCVSALCACVAAW